MTTALLYARISKDDRDDRLGVDRQERACRDLAAKLGLTVTDVLVDNDLSAFRKRPAFERLVAALEAGDAGAVVAYHADRLYRRTADLERLVDVVETTGAQVHTVAAGTVDLGTASGRMVARMLGAAAQHESERIGERCRMKHDELAAKGRYPGDAPYGYSAGYVVNPAEADAVRYMARRVLEGASLLATAREMDARGVPTREGRGWHHSTVRSVLVNPAVAGLRVHRREIAGPGAWEPVLDRATWEEVRAVLADPARKRKRPTRRYLLTGLVETAAGDPMTGRPDRGPGGEMTRRCYATRSPAKTSTSIGADDLEALVVEAVLAALDGAVLPVPDETPTAGGDVAALEAELADLARLRGEGTISLGEWLAAREPLQDRLAAAKAAAGTTRRPSAAAKLLGRPGAVREAWPALDHQSRREILDAVLARVVVGPANRGRWTPTAERVTLEWCV